MPEERSGARADIARLLDPGVVAVIGASEDWGKFGGRVFHLLFHHGFRGEVYPINPNREQVLGRRAYPSVRDTPRPADVAVLAVPKPFLQASVEACAAAGVGTAIVITSQFAEVGELGAAEEQALVAAAAAGGMRLVGPNCLGLISPANGVVLSSSPALMVDRLRVGPIGLVSQSGALMATIFDRANDIGIGFAHLVSVGNQADLELADFVEYFIADARVRVIGSYVEGFKDPARFVALARRARAAGKPWLMVKAGRTRAGERAAHSHTTSLAGSYAVLEAVARDCGVVLMDDPDAMVLAAATMARFGCPRLERVAVVTTSGGGGAIAADRLTEAGVELATFALETAAALDGAFMPGQATNPVDLGGRRGGEAVDVAGETLAAIAGDPGVDLSLLVLTTAPALDRIAADLGRAAIAAGQPYLFALWPGTAADGARERLRELDAPFCDRLDDAVRALAAWRAWSRLAPPAEPVRPADNELVPGHGWLPARGKAARAPGDHDRWISHREGVALAEAGDVLPEPPREAVALGPVTDVGPPRAHHHGAALLVDRRLDARGEAGLGDVGIGVLDDDLDQPSGGDGHTVGDADGRDQGR